MRALFVRAGVAVTVAAFAWGCLIERNLFTLRQKSVTLLPSGSEVIRILHLSDTHIAPWQHNKKQWIAGLAKLSPDAIVFTGDLLGHKDALEILNDALEPLAKLQVPMFFVYGSNDYFGPKLKNPFRYLYGNTGHEPDETAKNKLDTDALTKLLESYGAINLNNNACIADIRGIKTVIFGLNDPHIDYDAPDKMQTALRELNTNNVKLRIGVVHAPYQKQLNIFLDEGADIIFSGHTHGGQVCVPGIGALTSNSDLSPKQASGLSLWTNGNRHAYLHVSAGLGTSIFAPVRFACPPEASIVTLEAKNS